MNLNGNEPVIMGIVNVTPDSFSDGGRYLDPAKAITHGLQLLADGAGILDIGGESTRPGAAPVSVEEEIARVVPVIEGLKNSGALISIDTRNSATMKAALLAGARMINDISALTHDPESLSVAANSSTYICLMHMRGQPQTMQDNPNYEAVVQEVYDYLRGRVDACVQAGIDKNRIMIDPGIGFGKTTEHNVTLLKNLDAFNSIGCPVLLGASRKRLISALTGSDERMAGSVAVCLAAYQKGVKLFRVHDVRETVQALSVFKQIV